MSFDVYLRKISLRSLRKMAMELALDLLKKCPEIDKQVS